MQVSLKTDGTLKKQPRTYRNLLLQFINQMKLINVCLRILFLIMARHGRGCSAFIEPKEDENLSKKLCSIAYDEAQYISLNNYQHADLMAEISEYF